MDMTIDGQQVRRQRLERSWSQETLAEHAGVSLRTIQRVESQGLASLQTRKAVAAALEVQTSDIAVAIRTRSAGHGSDGDSRKPVLVKSRAALISLNLLRILVSASLWALMLIIGFSAFMMAFGGVFFWEYTNLSASQSAGYGILNGLLLFGVFLFLRWCNGLMWTIRLIGPDHETHVAFTSQDRKGSATSA